MGKLDFGYARTRTHVGCDNHLLGVSKEKKEKARKQVESKYGKLRFSKKSNLLLPI